VRLQQQTKLCEIPELLDGDQRHLKGTPPLGEHEALRDEPVQDFAQRRDADAVVLLEAFTPALLPGAADMLPQSATLHRHHPVKGIPCAS
jgi:hypothetical protein